MTTTEISRFYLKAGHVKPIWAGHPWVYAQAISRREGTPQAGDVIEVRDTQDKFLGRGFWSPKSAIPVRLLSRDPDEIVNEAAIQRRIQAARDLRTNTLGLPSDDTTGFRLIHAEGDSLPGLIVDCYGEVLVAQILTIGMHHRSRSHFR